MFRRLVPVVALLLAAAACTSDPEEAGTTTLLTLPDTGAATTTTPPSTVPDATSGTTAPPEPVSIDYQVRHKSPAEGGDRLVVLIDPGTYSDIDLENLIIDIMEENPDALDVDVIDSVDVLDAVVADPDGLTEQDAIHYLVRLVGGRTIQFLGPYEEFGQVAVGS